MAIPAYAALIFTPIFIGAIDVKRKDKIFLKNVFSSWQQVGFYCGTEYFLHLIPLIIFQISKGNWAVSLGIAAVCFLIGLLSPYIRTIDSSGYKKNITLIPLQLFELKFFIEKNKMTVLMVLFFAFLGVIHYGFFLVGIFLFIVLLPEVFKFTEPLSMVKMEKNFTLKKIMQYLKYMLPLWLIPTILTFIFAQCPIWLILYCLFCLTVSLILSVGYKYANYSGVYSYLPSSNTISLMVLLLVIPAGVLVTFAFSIYYLLKAEKNMQSFYAVH